MENTFEEIFAPIIICEQDLKKQVSEEHIPFVIKELQNRYFVSNKGQILNSQTLTILRTQKNNKGYERITLYFSNKELNIKFKKTFFVHTLVARCFCENPDKENKVFVHHKDMNTLNNNYTNLQWVELKEHLTLHNIKIKE